MAKLNFDLRFIEIEYELWALGQFLKFMEPQIATLQVQDEATTFRQLRESGWDDDEMELQLASQELRERQEFVVPRFMRGPFLVALWACYEAAVTEIASFIQRTKQAGLELSELRGDSLLTRARRYFDAVLLEPLDLDDSRYARLVDLMVIRHSLAHANGQRRAMTPRRWATLSDALTRNGTPADDYRGLVLLSPDYLKAAYSDVNTSLRDLVKRARAMPRRTT